MKSLAVLSPYAVVPPRYGGPLRVFNLCLNLPRRFSISQFAQQVQRGDLAASIKPVVSRVRDGYVEYASRDPASVVLYGLTSFVLNSPPIWQSSVLALRAPVWLRRILVEADLIHVEQPWQFRWAWETCGRFKPIVLGTENVEADLYPAERSGNPRPLARAIHASVAAQERFAVARASRILAVTKEDAQRLGELYQLSPDKISVIPNGVDCSRFVPSSEEAREAMKLQLGLTGKHVILFSGSLHFPNIEAANWIVGNARLLPREDVCFLIVGAVGDALPRGGAASLKVTGRVKDTRPYFEAADIAVNPMMSGGGSSLKQLEFMAMGLPTVTTRVGARGVRFQNGTHGYMAPLDQLLKPLATLIDDKNLRRRMGISARELAESEYNWPGIADRLAGIYDDVLLEEAGRPHQKERPRARTSSPDRNAPSSGR